MANFELDGNTVLTDAQRKQLANARKMPVVYDEDSPEMTEQMERAFMAARKAKPYQGEPLTLYVSPDTLKKVKAMGGDYLAILSRLLDKAVSEYPMAQ